MDAPTVVMVRADTPTSVLAAVPSPPPVFVDPSGRRRSRLRWIAYGLGLAGALYTGLVAASFLGAPIKSHTVLPFVEPTGQQQPWQPPPAPSLPAAAVPPSAAATRSAVPVDTIRVSTSPSQSAASVPTRIPSSPPPVPRPTQSTPAVPVPEESSTESPSAEPSPMIDPTASPDAATHADD